MSIGGTGETDKAHSPTQADPILDHGSENSDSPVALHTLPTAPATTTEQDNQSSDEEMSKRKSTPIIESLERRTESLRAESRRLQAQLYDSKEGEMLLRDEDRILDIATRPPHTSPSAELERQFRTKGAISIGAELHAMQESHRWKEKERRGGSSRGGSSKSKKKPSKKH